MFAGQLVIPLSKANIEALNRSETAEVEVEAYLSGSAIRTFTAAGTADSTTATVQKMILAEPNDDMPAKLSVECNVDVRKVGQDANGTISLCVMDNGEVMSSLLMMPVINGDGAGYETVMEDDFSQPPAMSIATETVQELQFVDEPVQQTVTAVEQSAAAVAAAAAAAPAAAMASPSGGVTAAEAVADELIPFHDILVSKPNTDFAVCEPHHVQINEEPLQMVEEFSVEKLILSLVADDADHCQCDSAVASLMVSPQLEVFEPAFPVPAVPMTDAHDHDVSNRGTSIEYGSARHGDASDDGHDCGIATTEPTAAAAAAAKWTTAVAAAGETAVSSGNSNAVASCSLTVACNTRKQLRKVLEHRRPASISH